MIDVSAFVKTLKGRPVAVYGLGLSNLSVIRALKAAGANVVAGDDDKVKREAAAALGAETPDDFPSGDFARFACLVLAPGIPLTHNPHPVVRKARAAGVEILCDIEILHRCRPRRVTVGITGTNGKSTTTALTAHILNHCGVPAVMGGNIGVPVLDLNLAPDNGALVLELSSFQLDLCPTFAPRIAVHLNLTPDHLDRHGTFEAYEAAKLRLFRGEGEAVIGVDDEPSRQMARIVEEAGARTVYPISVNSVPADMPALPPSLTGRHNLQNALAAWTVGHLLGCAPESMAAALRTFPGLNHRQFLVRTINGVAYINDSKATNADATAPALAAYGDIYWIVGGKAKAGGLNGLEIYKDRIRHAFLIGDAANDFADWMKRHGIPFTVSRTLENAVHGAAQQARSGTVLLSPACASYDQFKNFEERGDAFSALVRSLE